MTNIYNLYYNKDMKEAISVETKEYFNKVLCTACYYVKIAKANSVVTYHFNKETNEITNRFVD